MRKNRVIIWMMALVFLSADISHAAVEAGQKPAGTITMDADGVLLKDVLRVLSEQAKASFIASEEVESKRINLSFNRVPIEEALRSIATANNLSYERKGGGVILFYAPKSASLGSLGGAPDNTSANSAYTETRVYRLKYSRLSNSPIDVGGQGTIKDLEKLKDVTFSSSESSGGSSSNQNSSNNSSQSSLPGAFSNLTAARGIDRVISGLLTPSGKIIADIQTNSLIITDVPAKLDEIEKILVQIDRPAPQVLIEVYLMEVKKDVLTNHGVEWGGDDGALASFAGGSRTTGFPFTENLFGKSQGVQATTQGTSTLTLGTLSAADFQATLHFLTQDLNTKILARPRVLTLSNEAANIKLVTNTAIANQTALTTADGQATSTTNTAERSEVGITMKMTPQVNEDETVGLFVEPSITTVAASSFFPSTFLDPTTRVVRTVARVKNHQTLVIGGLMDKNGNQSVKKIPFLGDIPVAGNAFRYNDKSESDRELVIFITPHIVQGYDSFSDERTQPSHQRDVAMQKVLMEFEDSEMQTGLSRIESQQTIKSPVYRQEKNAIQKSVQSHETPAARQEMARQLESYGDKK